MFMFPPNLHFEILTHDDILLGGRAFPKGSYSLLQGNCTFGKMK